MVLEMKMKMTKVMRMMIKKNKKTEKRNPRVKSQRRKRKSRIRPKTAGMMRILEKKS